MTDEHCAAGTRRIFRLPGSPGIAAVALMLRCRDAWGDARRDLVQSLAVCACACGKSRSGN